MQIDLSRATAKPGIARPPTPGAGFSPFDDDISAGPSLELDVQGGGLPPRISSPSIPIARPAPPPPISQRSLAPHAPLTPPDGPAQAPIATDAFDAKALADYGPAPDAFWRTPLYAYRVMTRRAELRRTLARTKEEAESILKRVEDALVSLGERARSLAKDGGGTLTESMLERVRGAEELLRNRGSALSGARDSHQATLAEIDARLTGGEAELARAIEEETQKAQAHETADADVKRAEAKLKRVDIELRATGSAPTLPDAHTPEHEAAAAELARMHGEASCGGAGPRRSPPRCRGGASSNDRDQRRAHCRDRTLRAPGKCTRRRSRRRRGAASLGLGRARSWPPRRCEQRRSGDGGSDARARRGRAARGASSPEDEVGRAARIGDPLIRSGEGPLRDRPRGARAHDPRRPRVFPVHLSGVRGLIAGFWSDGGRREGGFFAEVGGGSGVCSRSSRSVMMGSRIPS